jgi:N-acetyl-anhydromuramyl-L-alanine amidase AmpD
MIAPDIIRLSPNVNHSPMPAGIKTVIIHSTRSGKAMNPTEFIGTLGYMSTPGTTSSHWVISRQGVKARVVNDTQQAWHAGEDNDNAWGIELEQGAEADGFTEPQLAALAEVAQGYVGDFGVPMLHVHDSHTDGFVGHQETAQGKADGKSDPGSLFDWNAFIASLNPAPQRVWLYGNEVAGCEIRSNQLFFWHLGVEVDAIGDYEGHFPGAHYHNEGGNWRQVLP